MHKYTLLVKCRVFAIKPDCTYNRKWVLKCLAIVLLTLMYYTLQYKGGLYFAAQCFHVSYMILPINTNCTPKER